MTRQDAHNLLDEFHKLCGSYNSRLFDEMRDFPIVLSGWLDSLYECKELILYLDGKETCEATRAYLVFCDMIEDKLRGLLRGRMY